MHRSQAAEASSHGSPWVAPTHGPVTQHPFLTPNPTPVTGGGEAQGSRLQGRVPHTLGSEEAAECHHPDSSWLPAPSQGRPPLHLAAGGAGGLRVKDWPRLLSSPPGRGRLAFAHWPCLPGCPTGQGWRKTAPGFRGSLCHQPPTIFNFLGFHFLVQRARVKPSQAHWQ